MTERENETLWAIVPALDLVLMTLQTCEDLLAQTVPVRVLLIDQGSSEASNLAFREFADHHHPRVVLWSFNPPLPSLAAAWNRGLDFCWRLGHEEALVVNSDVRLHPETARDLHTVRTQQGALFVSGIGVTAEQFDNYTGGGNSGDHGGPDFSCFLTTRVGHLKYPFDEGFIPCYGEDCDLHRRYLLSGDGAKIFSVNLPFHHIGGGSRTINQSEAAARAFQAQAEIGRQHYRAKWAGPPNQERFIAPYGPLGVDHVTNPELQARVRTGLPALEPAPPTPFGDRLLDDPATIRALDDAFHKKAQELRFHDGS